MGSKIPQPAPKHNGFQGRQMPPPPPPKQDQLFIPNAIQSLAYQSGRESRDVEIAKLQTALADAIRCPMGVVPASAEGLI